MNLAQYFPFWPSLSEQQRKQFEEASMIRNIKKGTLLHDGSDGCIGLLLVLSGRLRVYTLSASGREITLYRLLERDFCLFSATCIMASISFDVSVCAECDSSVVQISSSFYKQLMQQSAPVANYTNEVMASRFSDVMWLLDQILYKKLDGRLAAFLLEEMQLQDSTILSLTQEDIARHLGSVREVISRMLHYFSAEGLIRISRGKITVTDQKKLLSIAQDSLH